MFYLEHAPYVPYAPYSFTKVVKGSGHFLYGKESIPMQPWKLVDFEGCLYYAFLPVNQTSKIEENQCDEKDDEISKINIDNAENFVITSDNNVMYTDMLNNIYTLKVENENAFSMDELVMTDEDQPCIEEEEEEEVEELEEEEEDEKVYACDECNICFPVMQMLKYHQDTVHEQEMMTNTKNNVKNVTYKCNFCNYESTNKSTLSSHISRKHSTKRVIKRRRRLSKKIIEPEEYSCDVCGFKCPNRRRLKEHLDRKHGSEYKYNCEFCDKKFKVKSDMRLHVRFKHKESPIICDVCGKTCSNSNSLYVHQKWAHFKPKYKCEICKRRMVTQENLDQHILLQHERRESFVCEECGKSFSENHRLKQHMMTHTGDRPHDCHICGKAFARRTAFRQHLLIHTGMRPYVCDICGKAFTQKPGLICHRKSHPGVHPPLPVVHIDHILNDFMKKV